MKSIRMTLTHGATTYTRIFRLAEDELQDLRMTTGCMWNRGQVQRVTFDEVAGPVEAEGYKEATDFLGAIETTPVHYAFAH